MSSSSGNATDQTENTPLLAASQTTDEVSPRLIYNPSLWLMGIIFFFGASTGGYLLYIQGEDYPVSKPFFLVRRANWGSTTSKPSGPPYNNTELPLSCILITQVGQETCWDIKGCSRIVRDIQKCDKIGDVPFNFLVGGDGNTYEGQGWNNRSLIPLPESLHSTSCLVLSFIGNFTASLPNLDQLEEAVVWISESIIRNRLREHHYQIHGLRNLTRASNDGQMLFQELARWPHYNSTTGAFL